MSEITIFKNLTREPESGWVGVIVELRKRGYEVYNDLHPRKSDVSIVLSGKAENPLSFSGLKVLAWASSEWNPPYYGARWYMRILQHYYDDFINLTGTRSTVEAVDRIEEYIRARKWETSKPGSADREH